MTRPDKIYGLEIPYEKPVEELVQLTKEKPPTCWIAYAALAGNKSEKSIHALNNLLSNSDWTHVRSAIEAIGNNINGNFLEGKLITFLDNQNKFIVTATVKALSKLKSEIAHNKVKFLVNAENIEIKQAAIEGLSGIWQPSDFEFLLDCDKHINHEGVRKTIGFVLVAHVDKGNWTKFFDNYKRDKISRHRGWSLSFVSQYSKEQTLVALFINDKDGHIRRKAKELMETRSA